MAGGEFRFGTASIYMRRTSADRAARYNSQPRYYMATDLGRVRQFFPDFRRFIVMASRKLGLVETTMGRYKSLIGPRLRARGFAAQQTEAAIGVAVLNRMLMAGRPDSVRRQRVTA